MAIRFSHREHNQRFIILNHEFVQESPGYATLNEFAVADLAPSQQVVRLSIRNRTTMRAYIGALVPRERLEVAHLMGPDYRVSSVSSFTRIGTLRSR